MPDVVLMQPCFLGKVLTTLSAGEGARRCAGLVCLAMPPQRSGLPKGLATVRTGESGLGGGGGSQLGGPDCWTVAALMGDKGLGGGEGAGAGEADEFDPLQLLGHEVLWVLPLHVTLLELGIGKSDEAAGALQGPLVAVVTTWIWGTSLLGRILLLRGHFGVWDLQRILLLHDDWDPRFSPPPFGKHLSPTSRNPCSTQRPLFPTRALSRCVPLPPGETCKI